MRRVLFGVLSILSLILCLATSIIYFLGKISEESYRLIFLLASIGWFVLATLWATKRKKGKAQAE
jgi:hypothetical protein